MIDVLPSLAMSALVIGSIYALFSVSLNIVWSMANVVNIGHGEFLTLSAYATLFVVNSGVWLPAAFLGLGLATVLVSVGFYLLMIWALKERDLHYGSLLATWGVSLIIMAGLRVTVGTDFQSVDLLRDPISLGGLRTTQAALVVLVVAFVASGLVAVLIKRTSLGRSLRAIAQSPDLAASVGINVLKVRVIAFVGGTLLAVVAGVLVSTLYVFYPLVGQLFIIKSVAIVLVAGLGRLWLTWIAGMALGFIETGVQFQFGAQLADIVAYAALIGVLLFRREDILRVFGLLGGRFGRGGATTPATG